jgi:hypothetical protein
MASSSAAASSSDVIHVPPLPPKLRKKPQERGNYGKWLRRAVLIAYTVR